MHKPIVWKMGIELLLFVNVIQKMDNVRSYNSTTFIPAYQQKYVVQNVKLLSILL